MTIITVIPINLVDSVLYSILIICAIALVFYCAKRWKNLTEAEQKDFSKKFFIWGGLGLVLALVATGRAHWITGLLAGLVAIAARASQLAAYFPIFKKLFGQVNNNSPSQEVELNKMSRQQAADILGIDVNADIEEVRLAHKKLMQKIHPDRGGSELLAKQINMAKDVLMK